MAALMVQACRDDAAEAFACYGTRYASRCCVLYASARCDDVAAMPPRRRMRYYAIRWMRQMSATYDADVCRSAGATYAPSHCLYDVFRCLRCLFAALILFTPRFVVSHAALSAAVKVPPFFSLLLRSDATPRSCFCRQRHTPPADVFFFSPSGAAGSRRRARR